MMCSFTVAAAETKDSVNVHDSIPELNGSWIKQLYSCNFRINDPSIKYPKFMDFCRKVYNWGDKTFNRYDSDYVVGTGHNWKLYTSSFNWIQNYTYLFHDSPIMLHTEMYTDIGFTLNFMAVSIGYSLNMNSLVSANSDHRNRFNFSFTCALFSAEIVSRNTNGDIHLIKFGDYKDENGNRPDIYLNGMKDNLLSINAYYFFNHRKYSQGAAYNYSKYQLKSSGSWILGLSYNRQKISMDFSELPESVKQEIPAFDDYYNFRYSDYAIIGGYGYNCVLPHKWLYNITVLPSIGYRRTLIIDNDSYSKIDHENNIGVSFQSKMSLTYNHRSFFVSALLRYDGGVYFGPNYTFFNSTPNVSAVAGIRF